MKPDWDKLANEFADSKTVLIADVDCTVEKDLCSAYGVKGYPTIKYFSSETSDQGEAYKGGRDLNSLRTFATENIGPSCNFDNKELCNAEQLAIFAEGEAMSPEELAAWIEEQTTAIIKAESDFKEGTTALQDEYKRLMQVKEDTIAAIMPKLRLIRSTDKTPIKHNYEEDLLSALMSSPLETIETLLTKSFQYVSMLLNRGIWRLKEAL